MTPQAKNSLELYRGGRPGTIKQLLRVQRESVVKELMQYTNARDIDELAIRLSGGIY